MSIDNFRSQLTGGGARGNQFRVELQFPNFVSGGAAAARKGQFLCTSAALPGSSIGIASVFYRGREVKLAGEREFQNWTISVINDTDFSIYNAFEQWMNTINNVKENTGITNPNAITSSLNVRQLDRNDAVIKSYTIADAWPVQLSPIQLNFADNNRLEEFTVEFAYSFWDTTNSPVSVSATVGINTPIGSVGVSL